MKTASDLCASIDKCIERMAEGRARLAAGLASLTLTVDRWQPSSAVSEMHHGLALEPALLPKHKRRGTWRLESGKIMDVTNAHTMQAQEHKTTFLRSAYTMADLNMLSLARDAQARKFTYEDAERWLISRRNGRMIPNKRIEADPDPVDTTWRSRPGRRLTAEDLIRQSGLRGRALARELQRIK